MNKLCKTGQIVTLENDQEYVLIKNFLRNNVEYFLGVRYEDCDITDEFLIFRYTIDGTDEYLKPVKTDENDVFTNEIKSIVANEKHMIN